jgi:Holliday junction DNA helicase RuvB
MNNTMEVQLSPKAREVLKKVIEYEDVMIANFMKNNPGWGEVKNWSWRLTEVGLGWHDVRELVESGIITRVSKKSYSVNRELATPLLMASPTQPQAGSEKAPLDFSVIEGYDDLKRVFGMSLGAEKPVHILLVGPPATAKTMFLMEIEKLPESRFVIAGTMTRVGLRDVLFYEKPKYLLIDELDKINDRDDLSALLTWMESGRVVVTTHNVSKSVEGVGWVFAAANSASRLPVELLDRFKVFQLKPYTEDEYVRVAASYLEKGEKVQRGLAEYIVRQTVKFSKSVREAIRVARLAKTKEDVDFLMNVTQKYS